MCVGTLQIDLEKLQTNLKIASKSLKTIHTPTIYWDMLQNTV